VNFLFPYLPLPANRKRDFAQRKMASIYRDIISKRKAMKEEDHPPDMIWNLMNQQYKDGRPTTDTEVAHMMIALLMAGQHTSMALLHGQSSISVLNPNTCTSPPQANKLTITVRSYTKNKNVLSATNPSSTPPQRLDPPQRRDQRSPPSTPAASLPIRKIVSPFPIPGQTTFLPRRLPHVCPRSQRHRPRALGPPS